jgi:hypothetical protein
MVCPWLSYSVEWAGALSFVSNESGLFPIGSECGASRSLFLPPLFVSATYDQLRIILGWESARGGCRGVLRFGRCGGGLRPGGPAENGRPRFRKGSAGSLDKARGRLWSMRSMPVTARLFHPPAVDGAEAAARPCGSAAVPEAPQGFSPNPINDRQDSACPTAVAFWGRAAHARRSYHAFHSQ